MRYLAVADCVIRWGEGLLGTYIRLKKTWFEQIEQRRERVLAMVQEKVVVEAGLTANDGAVEFMEVVRDDYMAQMDDLDDLDKPAEVGEAPDDVEHTRDTAERQAPDNVREVDDG